MTSTRSNWSAAIAAACCTVACCALAARADRIGLRDGTTVVGTVKQVDGGFEVTLENGAKRFIASADIKSIKIDNTGKPDEATARDRLASLRRSTENERDVQRAIDRYEQLLALVDGTVAAGEARRDLATWRDRQDRKMVRVGKAWLTPADRDALYLEIARRADDVRATISAGDLPRASAQLREAAALDPENVSVLYLTGVVQYRQGKFAEARKSFDAVAEQVPDHPPTLVNQAVLLARFKQWPRAATTFEAAMAAAPGNPDILNNVTEFIQLVPEASRKSPALDKMMRRYGVQEAALEQQMAEQRKLYRWGTTWVDQAKLDALRKQRDESERTKRDLQTEYEQAESRIRQIDEDIRRMNTMIAQIENTTFVRDVNTGRVFQRPYPDSYWDLKRDVEVLNGRRRDEVAKIDEIRKKADKVADDAPVAPYTGQMEIIGEAGVPILMPAPASQPTAPTEATSQPADAAPRPTPDDEPVFIPFRPPEARPAASSQPSK